MARPRKTIATTVGFDVKALKEITSKMSDNELGAWIRKAVLDCLNGCTAQDTDPFIKASYESARSKMLARQNIDAQKYQNNLARQGKTPQEPTADSLAASANGAYNTPTRESETRGPQTDNNLAESATRTSEAIKALADASTREGEDERDHRGNTGILESSTSAKTLSEAREAQARESLPAGERGKRSRAISRPVDAPAGSPVEATPAKRPYGSCGHVMLTNEEGAHLREIYGENLAIAIRGGVAQGQLGIQQDPRNEGQGTPPEQRQEAGRPSQLRAEGPRRPQQLADTLDVRTPGGRKWIRKQLPKKSRRIQKKPSFAPSGFLIPTETQCIRHSPAIFAEKSMNT